MLINDRAMVSPAKSGAVSANGRTMCAPTKIRKFIFGFARRTVLAVLRLTGLFQPVFKIPKQVITCLGKHLFR